MQQVPNLVFFELLRFPVSELYVLRHEDVTLVHRGSFQVIYNPKQDVFLLKHGNAVFALDKSLQVIGAYSDAEKYPAYLIPTFDGFYMFKIMDNTPDVALTNLDTILNNTCVFRTKLGLEQKLGDVKEMHVDTKLVVLREAIHMTKDAIVRTLTPHNQHPNYTLLRTFEDLKNVNTDTIPMVDISPNDLERAKSEVSEVVNHHQSNKYWTYFAEYQGKFLSNSMSGSQFKSANATEQKDVGNKFQEDQKLTPKPTEDKQCDQTKGCDNISTVKTGHETEQQEIVGLENQRLPSYEVHHSKEVVEEGLGKAVERLDNNKFFHSCDMPPVQESQIMDDTKFTTGLLSTSNKKLEAPSPALDKDGEQQTLDAKGDPYRKDLGKDPLESETWGSNVSNPSETSAKLSEANLSAAGEAASEYLGDRPLVIQGSLSHSQSLTDKALGASPTKGNLSFKPNVSEKNTLKQKNISEQAGEKENATEGYLV